VNATTIRTKPRPASGRTVLAALALALLAALLAAQAAGAGPKDGRYQKTHRQRAADMAEGCRSAGGTPEVLESNNPNASHVRCDFKDYAVGCVFLDVGGYPDSALDACADSRGRTVPAAATLTGTLVGVAGAAAPDPTRSAAAEAADDDERR
jgi:hypothetical protein